MLKVSDEISNMSELGDTYELVGRRIQQHMERLRAAYKDNKDRNVYYKEVKMFYVVGFVILDIALAALFLALGSIDVDHLVRELQSSFIKNVFQNEETAKLVIRGTAYVALVLFLYAVYYTGTLFYSKRVERFGTRIDQVEKTLKKRHEEMKRSTQYQDIMKSINAGKDLQLPMKNDMGEEIMRIRQQMDQTGEKVRFIRQIVRTAVISAFFFFLYVWELTLLIGSRKTVSGVVFVLLCAFTAVFVHLFEFKLGEYLGKFSKVAGIGLAAVSSLLIALNMKKYLPDQFLDIDISAGGAVFNHPYLIIPVIFFIGMVLGILFTHYDSEIDKWKNGFEVEMKYGEKPRANKRTIIFRLGMTVLMSMYCCWFGMEEPSGVWGVILGIFWYLANPLMKPRGSYVYAFFGVGKCIANEVILAAMLLCNLMGAVGTLSFESIFSLIVAFAFPFVCGAVATMINNMIV